MEEHTFPFWVCSEPRGPVLALTGFRRVPGAADAGLCLGRLLPPLAQWDPSWCWDEQTFITGLINLGWTQQGHMKKNQFSSCPCRLSRES